MGGQGGGGGGRGGSSGWVLGIVGIVAGIVVAFVVTATGHATLSRIGSIVSGAQPSCSDPKWLLQVPDNQITSSAIYVYEDHYPDLTVDGSRYTAWLQWWPTSDFKHNIPQYNRIAWSLSSSGPYDLRLICIEDGWDRDTLAYGETEAIRNAMIGLNEQQCPNHNETLSNTYLAWQQVNVSCQTSKVTLYVKSTYRPAGIPDCVPPPVGLAAGCRTLTGISEIKFYYSPRLFFWPL
jgi:hypothetical protein